MINNFFSITSAQDNLEMSPEYISKVNNEIREINFKRFHTFSIVTSIIELILIVFHDIPSIIKGNSNLLISIMYLIFHSLILCTSLTVFFIINNYEKNESSKVPNLITEISVLLFMVFVACISGIDQIAIGQATSYIVGLALCGVVVLIKPPRNFIIYSIAHIIFIVRSFLFQKNQGVIVGNIINGTVFYLSVLVLSKLTYENQVNILIKNIILEETNEKLEYLSNYDGLTNLFNRRHFEDVIKTNIKENNAYDEKNAIMAIMDIDYFKSINDKYGHKAGDVALKKLQQ